MILALRTVAKNLSSVSGRKSIILFTAFLDDETIARAEALGVRACLTKDQYDELPAALWHYGPAA